MKSKVCCVDGCYRRINRSGDMCSMHRYRVEMHGSTDLPVAPSMMDRFWSKVSRGSGTDACWMWNGSKLRCGYGTFRAGRPIVRVHRFVLELTIGRKLRPGEVAMHTCDVRACCNPRHLKVGTVHDNALDAASKGRTTWGDKNHHARLTNVQAAEIRSRAKRGHYSELAREFGVSSAVVRLVAIGRTYRLATKEAA